MDDREWAALSLLLTAKEVARILRVGKNSVYALMARKDFPTVRLGISPGSSLRVSRDGLRAWIERESQKSA